MLTLIHRLVWFFLISVVVALATFLILGSFIERDILGDARRVLARDSLRPGEHHLTGMVSVPSTCHQLSVKTEEVDTHLFNLRFTTWKEPHVDTCTDEDTPRAFRAIVFAPAVGVHITATLDDAPLQLVVYTATPLSSL